MRFKFGQKICLVGIKGVGMTALAQCLADVGAQLTGVDLAENFVTQPMLNRIPELDLRVGFEVENLPLDTELVIYSGAHGGQENILVRFAREKQIPTLNLAQALGELFNAQTGWAVCGANGKSTVSAMLAWSLMQLQPQQTSFSVGVGHINGLDQVGRWRNESTSIFVAEADEYVQDITTFDADQARDPAHFPARFMTLQPQLIIANNISWDHPDVYHDLSQTMNVFYEFFLRLQPGGRLIVNYDDQNLRRLIPRLTLERPDIQIFTFGFDVRADLFLGSTRLVTEDNQTWSLTDFSWQQQTSEEPLKLSLPGQYNIYNAAAALAALLSQFSSADALSRILPTLTSFQSTARRFEKLGELNQVLYVDDYAHHPDEITAVITAAREWFAPRLQQGGRLVVAFQAHTYTRTIELFSDFIASLGLSDQVLLIEIFPSARESAALADQVSSDQMAAALNQVHPSTSTVFAQNLQTVEKLAIYCQRHLQPHDVLLSLGAGDIYHFWDFISA